MTDANATLTGAEPRCLECGYLLIGLPQERCPECGTAFTWAEVIAAAGRRGLPIEEGRGWRRLTGALLTWLLVLFRPITFARRVDRYTSLGLATVFAVACVAIGVVGLALANPGWFPVPARSIGWAVGIWVHIELQSLLLLLVDLRGEDVRRQWMAWRKISLYTTAFVALESLTGPPPFGSDSGVGLPLGMLASALYIWWLAVLVAILAVRMKRKWALVFVVPALLAVSIVALFLGLCVTEEILRATGSHPILC